MIWLMQFMKPRALAIAAIFVAGTVAGWKVHGVLNESEEDRLRDRMAYMEKRLVHFSEVSAGLETKLATLKRTRIDYANPVYRQCRVPDDGLHALNEAIRAVNAAR